MTDQEWNISRASCELSGYKKGYITVKLDFITNILTWKDSNHWYNNFVRGLPKSQMQPIHDAIIHFLERHIADCGNPIDQPDSPQPYVWHIEVVSKDAVKEYQGYNVESADWLYLVECIENVVNREFRL